jgi:hypothetical protein
MAIEASQRASGSSPENREVGAGSSWRRSAADGFLDLQLQVTWRDKHTLVREQRASLKLLTGEPNARDAYFSLANRVGLAPQLNHISCTYGVYLSVLRSIRFSNLIIGLFNQHTFCNSLLFFARILHVLIVDHGTLFGE